MTVTMATKTPRKLKAPKLVPDELLDQLLTQATGKNVESILGESGLASLLKKQLAERMLAADMWRRQWEQVIPFFVYPPEERKIIYTTNAIESMHMQLRSFKRERFIKLILGSTLVAVPAIVIATRINSVRGMIVTLDIIYFFSSYRWPSYVGGATTALGAKNTPHPDQFPWP